MPQSKLRELLESLKEMYPTASADELTDRFMEELRGNEKLQKTALEEVFRLMASNEPLRIVVEGTSIIVTMPGKDFSVTYQKQFGTPNVVSIHGTSANHESRAAFHAAVDKARELGWIV